MKKIDFETMEKVHGGKVILIFKGGSQYQCWMTARQALMCGMPVYQVMLFLGQCLRQRKPR